MMTELFPKTTSTEPSILTVATVRSKAAENGTANMSPVIDGGHMTAAEYTNHVRLTHSRRNPY